METTEPARLLPTLITHRPDVLQCQYWATRDGVPFRVHLRTPEQVDTRLWRSVEVLVIDVTDFQLLEELYGPRTGFVLLVGRGDLDEQRAVRLWKAGRSNGFGRLDRINSRSALLTILDGFRQGQGARLMEVLNRA